MRENMRRPKDISKPFIEKATICKTFKQSFCP